jgi:hypothetical protein
VHGPAYHGTFAATRSISMLLGFDLVFWTALGLVLLATALATAS